MSNFTPAWFKKGFFNESLFCDDFLSSHTGRPLADGAWFQKFRSNYIDIDNEPLYPFGFGLSYTCLLYTSDTEAKVVGTA